MGDLEEVQEPAAESLLGHDPQRPVAGSASWALPIYAPLAPMASAAAASQAETSRSMNLYGGLHPGGHG